MHKHSLFCRAAALVLTLALTAALALPGFAAAYAMPIQTCLLYTSPSPRD